MARERLSLESKERIEVDYWRDSESERPGSDSLANLANKFGDLPVLLERLNAHGELRDLAGGVLELGAGQAWASCALRRYLPQAGPIVASDISVHALRSIRKWEHIYSRRLAGGVTCRSYSLPFKDGSLKVIFAFQAAHHFVAHRRTLAEVHRVLSPGGLCLYLHEPTCEEWIHPLAWRRVNEKRSEVPEDVLVYRRVLRIARTIGFEAWSVDDCSLAKRGPMEFLYYFLLGRVAPLRMLLPCTRDLAFRKPAAVGVAG